MSPKERAAWIYGQPMNPCPACGSYNMKPQTPVAIETNGTETIPELVRKWAKVKRAGATPLKGPCYYACWDCKHRGPSVNCAGRTSEDVRQDRVVNTEMKRLWNSSRNVKNEP